LWSSWTTAVAAAGPPPSPPRPLPPPSASGATVGPDELMLRDGGGRRHPLPPASSRQPGRSSLLPCSPFPPTDPSMLFPSREAGRTGGGTERRWWQRPDRGRAPGMRGCRSFFEQHKFFSSVVWGCGQRRGRETRDRRVHRVGTCVVGEKKISFLADILSKLLFFGTSYSFHPIHFQKHMTGGSGVRGKTGPIWVRKVFNCLRSL
jgi:hypothetical protein